MCPVPANPQAIVAPTGVSLANRLSLYSPEEWEQFIQEWMQGFQPAYVEAQRMGGAGDKGRDVVGYTGHPGSDAPWDNYQCKHYAKPLQPSNIWIELGKMCYYTWKNDFRPPRKYRFVAPNEVSPTLKELLQHPDQLKNGLVKNWATYCQNGITDTAELKLEGGLLSAVEAYDYSIYGYETLQSILTQHSRTVFWNQRFQQAMPTRPAPLEPPETPDAFEAHYVKQLLDAYSDKENSPIATLEALKHHVAHHDHFKRSRKWFYSAESLNRFTRDQLKPGAFDQFKQQIYDGVVDTVEAQYSNALERVKATTALAATLQLAQNEVAQIAEVADKQGACHHLVNEQRLVWKT